MICKGNFQLSAGPHLLLTALGRLLPICRRLDSPHHIADNHILYLKFKLLMKIIHDYMKLLYDYMNEFNEVYIKQNRKYMCIASDTLY